jgi:hypothetical protein
MIRQTAAQVLGLSTTPDFFVDLSRRMIQRLHSPRNRRKEYRWVLVADATMHGSGFSVAICEQLGFDPHEKV